MQALIVHDDPTEADRLRAALRRAGFEPAIAADQEEASALARRTAVDLLVLKQVIGRRHTTSVALAGELRNPRLATILLSDRDRLETRELFDLVPSLAAILGPKPDAALLAVLGAEAVAGARNQVLILAPQSRVDSLPPRNLGAGFASRRSAA